MQEHDCNQIPFTPPFFTVRNEVAKVMFSQVSVCPQGVCSRGAWYGGPGPGGLIPWGCLVWGVCSGGVGVPACTEADPPPPQRETATAADGTYPTGMLSCSRVNCHKRNHFDHFEGAATPDQPGLRTFMSITNFAEGVGRSDPSRSQYHRYTANYFLSQPHSDRRCEELPWHLDMCDDMKLLCQVLAEPK